MNSEEMERRNEIAAIIRWLREFSAAVLAAVMAANVKSDTALKLWNAYVAKVKRLAQLIEEER